MSRAQPEKGTQLNAVEIHDNILAPAEEEIQRPAVPIIPLLEHRDRKSFHGLQRMWLLLLLGNLVGALLFAWALARTAMVRPDLHPALERVASEAVSGGFGQVLYAGVFAGWLIALMTWLLAATRFTGAQIALIWLCTAPISAFGFRHSIAGSVEAFYLAARGLGSWLTLAGEFIVPAVLGNAIGGVLLVALLNYGQVAPEKAEKR